VKSSSGQYRQVPAVPSRHLSSTSYALLVDPTRCTQQVSPQGGVSRADESVQAERGYVGNRELALKKREGKSLGGSVPSGIFFDNLIC
jgi:hypothetical protein